VEKYFLNFATNKTLPLFSEVLSERGVLLFIVETDSGDLQRLLSYFILTRYALDYRLSMPKDNLKKTRVLVPAITAALVVMMAGPMLSTSVFAAAPTGGDFRDRGFQFRGQPDVTCDPETGVCTATGEVSGAGTGGEATLSVTVGATVGCLTNEPRGNPGGGQNEPQGQRDVATTETASETFETDAGRGEFSVDTDPVTIEDLIEDSDFECPSANMTPVLVDDEFTFTDISLTLVTDEGKEISATFADQ
jgi:hypothetical protein